MQEEASAGLSVREAWDRVREVPGLLLSTATRSSPDPRAPVYNRADSSMSPSIFEEGGGHRAGRL